MSSRSRASRSERHSVDVKLPTISLEGSSSSSRSSDRSAIDYAAALQKVPGFQGYRYHSDGSTTAGSTADERPLHSWRVNRFSDARLSEKPVTFKPPTARRGSVTFDMGISVLPTLKDISRRREILLQYESGVKTIHRKLKSLRGRFLREISYNDVQDAADEYLQQRNSIRKWQRHEKALRTIVSEMTAAEEELEVLQTRLQTTHWEVKMAEDDLYAALTGGTRPGDSDVSFEDRLLRALVLDPSALPSECARFGDAETADQGVFQASPLDNAGLLTPPVTVGQSRKQLTPADLDHGVPDPPTRQSTPPQMPQQRRHSEDEALAHKKETKVAQRKLRRYEIDLPSLGSWAQEHDLEKLKSAANRHPLLVLEQIFTRIRKNDFIAEFGFGIDQLDSEMSILQNQQEKEPMSVAQSLANIDVETIHTRQLISLWLRQMWQNAALELSRTQNYAEDTSLDSLAQRGNVQALLKVVAVVRKIEVSFGPDSNENLLTIGRNSLDANLEYITRASSVDVQPDIDRKSSTISKNS